MRIFWKEASFEAACEARARRHIVVLLERYSENELCLRHAVAAQLGVDVKHIIPKSMLLRAMREAVRAFAKSVEEERDGV